MAFRRILVGVSLSLFLGSQPLPASSNEGDAPHWGYSGEHGPESWGKMKKEFSACDTGRSQSPIDLKWSKPKDTRNLEFDYHATGYRVVDNGHTVQVNFDSGNRLMLDGKPYDLLQLHFHSESEHRISGKAFPLEVHLVHKNSAGKLAVVGVFFKEGNLNLPLGKVWAGVPTRKNNEAMGEGKFNPSAFIPAARTHYHYLGSLTTPPCSEGVSWNVLNTPLEASRAQIERFRGIHADNNRPLQRLHGRRPANY